MTTDKIPAVQDEKVFLRPKLTGKRFETHTIPLDFLADISVLQDILVEVAKADFLAKHPEKKRTPKNFTNGISLGLSSIEEGSAIPVINLVFAVAALLPAHQAVPYFENARETVINAIAEAAKGNSVVDILPSRALSLFNKFGQGLEEGDTIEFFDNNGTVRAQYNQSTRERIISESPLSPIDKKITSRGYVTEIDRHKKLWTFMFNDGKKVSAPLDAVSIDDVCDALKRYNPDSIHNARVSLEGMAEFLGTEIRSIKSIESIVLLDPLDIASQIDDLRCLKSGWYDGEEGSVFLEQGLDWLVSTWEGLQPDDVVLPHLYPTPSGDVQAEWTFGHHEILLRIDIKRHQGLWHCMKLDVQSEDDEERDLDLDTIDEWNWVFQNIFSLQEGLV